jgi:two-component system cell cycle response regulator CpdR
MATTPLAAQQRATRVLIVDDKPSIRSFSEGALRLDGYETAVAAAGAEALRIAKDQGPFDLLLVDYLMPDMLGDELARRLRRSYPELKVLYFTAYSDRLFSARQTLWEDEAFIEKPITLKGLLEAVSLVVFGDTRRGGRGTIAATAPGLSLRVKRVSTPPLPVRIGGATGRLMNVSATGALVRMTETVTPERECQAVIETDPDPAEIRARVVRSQPMPGPPPEEAAAGLEYAVALAFLDLPPAARAALEALCGDAFSEHE